MRFPMRTQPVTRFSSFVAINALIAAFLVAAPVNARAQQATDIGSRDMQDSTLFRSRPATKRAKEPKARRYRRSGTTVDSRDKTAATDPEIGLTIWRLRPSLPGDPRDIVHEATATSTALTPVRLTGEDRLSVGENFRFAIESSTRGYLYVVNRPMYDAGPPRDPYLIFPTRRIRGGENAVSGGQVVELPTPFDSPPQFTISQRGDARLIAEEVIVLVSPKPLELEIGPDPLRLSSDTVDEWERRWGRPVERFEYESGDGMLYTAEEKAARLNPRYRISRDGPAPQVLFRIPAGQKSPVFLRITISVRQPDTSVTSRPGNSLQPTP